MDRWGTSPVPFQALCIQTLDESTETPTGITGDVLAIPLVMSVWSASIAGLILLGPRGQTILVGRSSGFLTIESGFLSGSPTQDLVFPWTIGGLTEAALHRVISPLAWFQMYST